MSIVLIQRTFSATVIERCKEPEVPVTVTV
jgi:hypothetical protein